MSRESLSAAEALALDLERVARQLTEARRKHFGEVGPLPSRVSLGIPPEARVAADLVMPDGGLVLADLRRLEDEARRVAHELAPDLVRRT